MITCNSCKKEKDLTKFISNNKQTKTCFECREQSRKWRENNKEYIRSSSREYIRYRLLNDELFKLKYYTRNMIRKSLQ